MYAAKTTVSPERSLEEIKRVLRRYGADKFGQAESRETESPASVPLCLCGES